MKLFSTLAAILAANCTVTLVIRKNENGRLVASTVFKNDNVKDAAVDLIAPFVVSGSPEELDAEFLDAIKAPMEKSSGFQTSLQNFEAQQKVAQANSAAAKAAKDAADKARKDGDAKAKKLKDEADALAKDKKYKQAVAKYEEALKMATGKDASDIKKAIEECKKKEAPDIFSSFDDEEPAEAPAEVESQEQEPAENEQELSKERSDGEPETEPEENPEEEDGEAPEDEPDPEDFD